MTYDQSADTCKYYYDARCEREMCPMYSQNPLEYCEECWFYAEKGGARNKPRKRCKKCDFFRYGIYGYECEITGEVAYTYEQLKECDTFKKKNSEAALKFRKKIGMPKEPDIR